MAEPLPSVVVEGEGARLVREKGVLMVYSKWVRPLRRGLRAGDLVAVEDEYGELLGCGLYDNVGPVALRLVELWGCSFSSVGEVLAARLGEALEARRRAGLVGAEAGYRLVHSDGDMLPGLIVDVYADLAVVQSSSAAWDRHLAGLAEKVAEVTGARRVYEKSTQRTRRDIGLPPRERMLLGSGEPRAVIREGEARFVVDARMGQKTGFFLDQRLNRLDFGSMAWGRVLDLFAYTGGFGIHALLEGSAEHAVFVEEDEDAARLLWENLRLNGLEEKARIVVANAWQYLGRAMQRRLRFDSIAVDPPAFIPHPGAYERGRKGYQRLYSHSARVAARREALLLLSSCSAHLPRSDFAQVVAEAMAQARRSYTPIGGVRGMPPDHPARPAAPHLEYLKAMLLLLH